MAGFQPVSPEDGFGAIALTALAPFLCCYAVQLARYVPRVPKGLGAKLGAVLAVAAWILSRA